MTIEKQEFNNMVASGEVQIRPIDIAYYQQQKYKIQKVESHHKEVKFIEINKCNSCKDCKCGDKND